MSKKQNLYIDIFAGCGGLSTGLLKAGWTGLFAVEKNADAFAGARRDQYHCICTWDHVTGGSGGPGVKSKRKRILHAGRI